MKVTIAIPFYNPGPFLRDAIASVLKQTYTDFELLLVNDGSADESIDIARSFDDPRITVVDDGENHGLAARLNEINAVAQGELIARMDADDVMDATRIERQVAFLDEHREFDLVATGVCSMTNGGEVAGYRLPTHACNARITARAAIFNQSQIAHPTVMTRAEWSQRNPYTVDAKLAQEDYRLWIDAALRDDLNVGFITEPLLYYREDGSVSASKCLPTYLMQIRTVMEEYGGHLTVFDKCQFLSLMAGKIAVASVAAFLGQTRWLVACRNRRCTGDPSVRKQLQERLDRLLAAKLPTLQPH